MKPANIILLNGTVETLSYFTGRLSQTFQNLGYSVHIFDFINDFHSLAALPECCQKPDTVLVTFNFIGLSGEQAFIWQGSSIWDAFDVLCLNIVVDHPFYYHKNLEIRAKHYRQFCVDRLHVTYMKRFFPEVDTFFLPLAGTLLNNQPVPYKDRMFPVLFTGNYTPPDKFEPYITRLGDEYADFYRSIIAQLKATPDITIEEAVERHLFMEIEELTEGDIKACMPNMIFIDLYIRFYYRGLVIKTLAESGIKVHILGNGWEQLDCRKKENLILGGPVLSETCLEHMGNAKISLNIMPWFKEGAHDRIFNSMLASSLCVSDSSRYLEELFPQHKELCFYSLEHLETLPDQINELLANQEKAGNIAEEGYLFAKNQGHTWEDRASQLIKHFQV